jgi:hypothetical protein
MNDPKRYSVMHDGAFSPDGLVEYEYGPLVSFSDYAALRAERDALQSKLDFHRDRTAEAVAENKEAKAQLAALRAERDALREAAGRVCEVHANGSVFELLEPIADLRALLNPEAPR